MKTWIPDFSQWNGKPDFDVLAGKIPAAIIRTGYGDDIKSQDDVYAAYNMRECARLGIPMACYLYSYADSDAHIRSEIAHEKRMTKGFDVLAHILDIEEWGNRNFARRACDLWLQAFPDTGIIYAGQSYWNGPLKGLECRRWIPAYGSNNGRRQDGYKPKMDMVGWQFTSRYRLPGVNGNVDMSEWYGFPFANIDPVEIKKTRRVVTKKEVAAFIMKHLCLHSAHGYTQDMDKRQGTGTETIDIYGKKYTIKSGDRDCSSAVISAYEAAGISCGGATYTGNMRKCMTGTGNFVWRPMSFIAQMGDSYLFHNSKTGAGHTAMCLSAEPDVLMEFSINEKKGTLGGKVGDQLQKGEDDETFGQGESHLKLYYDYPWDGILQCVNEEIAFVVEENGAITYDEKDDGFTVENKKPAENKADKSDNELALEVWADIHGKGDARKRALGVRFDSVQREVERLGTAGTSALMEQLKSYEKKHGALFK